MFCGKLVIMSDKKPQEERTFIMVKPDGVHRGVVGEIIKRFEQKGYRLVAMKFEWVRCSHHFIGKMTVVFVRYLYLQWELNSEGTCWASGYIMLMVCAQT